MSGGVIFNPSGENKINRLSEILSKLQSPSKSYAPLNPITPGKDARNQLFPGSYLILSITRLIRGRFFYFTLENCNFSAPRTPGQYQITAEYNAPQFNVKYNASKRLSTVDFSPNASRTTSKTENSSKCEKNDAKIEKCRASKKTGKDETGRIQPESTISKFALCQR